MIMMPPAIAAALKYVVSTLMVLLMTTTAVNADMRYKVYLHSNTEHRTVIGELVLSALGKNQSYQFTLEDTAFTDHFLSMRPFKCLSEQGNMLCYLPYPYNNRRSISRDDLTDLEYDLLFIARTKKEYGIDPWNGRYFQLRWQGEVIIGELAEVDLNILASPPEEGDIYPIVDADLTLVEPGVGWLPYLSIEPFSH
ncbi:MAG: hypothetical protein KBT53_10655 [Porticoccus sp.]|nr:hypothetical protein [Porticoccus sp.]MBQ0806344.1 hypothetical protein [Porticoccus sp.]